MEYQIFRYIRHHIKIPFFIRFILSSFLIFLSSIPIILPLFPGSLFVWMFIFVVWFLFIIPWSKIKYVIKLRKSIFYMMSNFHRKRIIEHKMKDIKEHVRDILKN